MIKVAITGNIGSGKSTACQVFETLGIPIFYGDQEAKNLYQDPGVILLVKQAFGEEFFDLKNQLIKSKLASLIFQDSKALQMINEIIHPRLMQRYSSWSGQYAGHSYTLLEAAVIFENGLQGYFDKIINVSAPIELRIKRIMKRDKLSRRQIENRISKQWPDEKKNKLADFIILSDNKRFMIPQVIKIHKTLIQ